MPSDLPPGAKSDTSPELDPMQQAQKEMQKLTKGQAMDSELAAFLGFHIDNPCGFETPEGVKLNIRDFYIREAERLLPNFTNTFAKEFLEKKIAEYKK